MHRRREMRKNGVTAILIMALLLLPILSSAEEYQRETLRGLRGVHVLIENMQPGAEERFGLTKEQLKTDIELRLRKAGVRVLTTKEMFATAGMPNLYLNLNAFAYSPGVCAFCAYKIKLALIEKVTLARGFKAQGSIWNTNALEINLKKEDIRQKVRDKVGELIDEFINDYLAANQK